MKKKSGLLAEIPLFRGIPVEEIDTILFSLGAGKRQYQSGEGILFAGEKAEQFGIVLAGRVQVLREEATGDRALLANLLPGDLFGKTYACAAGERQILPVTVRAGSLSEVLLFPYQKLLTPASLDCALHMRLMANMLAILAEKNLLLNRRLGHLSKRATREKVLSYLKEEALRQKAREFTIPFDRQGLADYLCVERSALSAVLGKLRKEGILEFQRSRFVLKDLPEEL